MCDDNQRHYMRARYQEDKVICRIRTSYISYNSYITIIKKTNIFGQWILRIVRWIQHSYGWLKGQNTHEKLKITIEILLCQWDKCILAILQLKEFKVEQMKHTQERKKNVKIHLGVYITDGHCTEYIPHGATFSICSIHLLLLCVCLFCLAFAIIPTTQKRFQLACAPAPVCRSASFHLCIPIWQKFNFHWQWKVPCAICAPNSRATICMNSLVSNIHSNYYRYSI